jgi:CHAT domain-containing protein
MEYDLSAARALVERAQFGDALEIIGTGEPRSWAERELRARCLAGVGRVEDSLAELERAAVAAEAAGDLAAAAAANVARGNLYVRLSRPRDALRVLSRVFAWPNQPSLAPLLFTCLADAYTQLEDWQRAEDLSDDAALFMTEVHGGYPSSDPAGYALVADRKLAIARLAARTGRHRRALYVLEGIEIEGAVGASSRSNDGADQPRFAARLEALMPEVDLQAADSLAATGDLSGARERYRRARTAGAARGDTAIEIDAMAGEGIVALRSGDHREALHSLRQAARLAERWRDEFVSEDFRIGLRARQARLYDALVDVAVAVGDAPLAWHFMELARAREYLSAIHRGAVESLGVGPTDEHIASLAAEIQAVSSAMATAGITEARFGELRERREQLLNEKAMAIDEFRRRDTLAAQILSPSAIDADEAMTALGSDTALVQYHLTGEAPIAIVVTSEGVVLVPIPAGAAAIRRRVQRYLQLVSKPDLTSPTGESWQEVGEHLYYWLWEPVTSHVAGCRRICLVAHGPLQALPFATIGRGEPLVDRFELVQAPSAGVIGALADRRARQTKRVSVLANPLPDSRSLSLPATRYEAAAIGSTDLDVSIYLGAEATVSQARRAAGSADILHLACHAEYDARRPLLTALLLAPNGGNGRLEVHEIYRMAVAASLVVLSACDTARIPESPGTELEGLVRSFMAAGASAVVGSQWLVQDAATAQLMRHLYQNLAAGDPPAQALREAQLSLAGQSASGHPYFWGAFSFHGRWW